MVIICPTIRLNTIILQILQGSSSELATLGNDFSTCIILDALRSLSLCQSEQLINEDILQVVSLCLVLLINLCKYNLILLLGFTSLHCT